ncbi:hypothetical protein [Burkholderia thailandensis]|uniref:hypothetical protein n=1 Tax=Burkholderia thailandensis TaxID=57975 RepID=UPI0012D2D4E3|nr:hypothetical protein [Burkholderia thailandensis]MCZ2894076.1 hypothetical protein [Burkholderia thailandensis]
MSAWMREFRAGGPDRLSHCATARGATRGRTSHDCDVDGQRERAAYILWMPKEVAFEARRFARRAWESFNRLISCKRMSRRMKIAMRAPRKARRWKLKRAAVLSHRGP